MAEWGALPPEYFEHPALRSLAAVRLREDFEFSDSLHERDPIPLRCNASIRDGRNKMILLLRPEKYQVGVPVRWPEVASISLKVIILYYSTTRKAA